jgi:hypothetical protein
MSLLIILMLALVLAVAGRLVRFAVRMDTEIATAAGWSTMGALQSGDEVFDEEGRPARVVAVSDVIYGRDCFEVVFSDGSTLVADAEHLWVTETRADRTRPGRVARRGGYQAIRVGSDSELEAVASLTAGSGPAPVTRRDLAHALGWDAIRGFRRVKTASSRCTPVGKVGREVIYEREELLERLAEMLATNVGLTTPSASRRDGSRHGNSRELHESETAARIMQFGWPLPLSCPRLRCRSRHGCSGYGLATATPAGDVHNRRLGTARRPPLLPAERPGSVIEDPFLMEPPTLSDVG